MTTIIELVVVFIFIVLAVTQVILPFCGYGRFFGIFRKQEKKIDAIDSEMEEIKLERVVEAKEKEKQNFQQEGGRGNDNKENSILKQ